METVIPTGLKISPPSFIARWRSKRTQIRKNRAATDTGGERPSAPLVAIIHCLDISESMMAQICLQGAGIPFRAQGDSDPFRMMWSVCTIYVGQEDVARAEEALNQTMAVV